MSSLDISSLGASSNIYSSTPPSQTHGRESQSGAVSSAVTALSSNQLNAAGGLSNASAPSGAVAEATNLLASHVEAMAGAARSGSATTAQKVTSRHGHEEENAEGYASETTSEDEEDSLTSLFYTVTNGNVSNAPPPGTYLNETA